MRTKLRALALALAATALTAGAADAAIELQSYSFTATTDGPITNHSGSFVLAYDDVADTYSLNAINFSLGDYEFNVSNAFAARFFAGFIIGGNIGGQGVNSGTNDFWLFTTNRNSSFLYTVEGGPVAETTEPTITRTDLPTPGAVPEPTSWALMILGFGAAGAALRRRRLAIA